MNLHSPPDVRAVRSAAGGMQSLDSSNNSTTQVSSFTAAANSKVDQSYAAYMEANPTMEHHRIQSSPMSRSDVNTSRYPHQGAREGWKEVELGKNASYIPIVEYPSYRTVLFKTRPSICLNTNQDCSEEHLTPTTANPPRRGATLPFKEETAGRGKYSNTQQQDIHMTDSTRWKEQTMPVNDDAGLSNSVRVHDNHLRCKLINFRKVHPAPPHSLSTHMTTDSRSNPEKSAPAVKAISLPEKTRRMRSLFHVNGGLGERSLSTESTFKVAGNDDFSISLIPHRSMYGTVETSNLDDGEAEACMGLSLQNGFDLANPSLLESDEDDTSVFSFVPKTTIPTHLSRTDVFGEDPPTPSSSTYHDADSQPRSGSDFSQSQADLDVSGVWSDFVTEDSTTDLTCDFPDVIEVNVPFHNDVESFFTPRSPSTSSSTHNTEENDFTAAIPWTSPPTVQPHAVDVPSSIDLLRLSALRRDFTLTSKAAIGCRFPVHASDECAALVEEYRLKKTLEIKEKVLTKARARDTSLNEVRLRIENEELEARTSCRYAPWSFKVRKQNQVKSKKEQKTKGMEKSKNMAFIMVHVIEYDTTGRQLLETRIESREKVYIDDEEFEGSFPPVDRCWRSVHPSERRSPCRRRSGWHHSILRK